MALESFAADLQRWVNVARYVGPRLEKAFELEVQVGECDARGCWRRAGVSKDVLAGVSDTLRKSPDFVSLGCHEEWDYFINTAQGAARQRLTMMPNAPPQVTWCIKKRVAHLPTYPALPTLGRRWAYRICLNEERATCPKTLGLGHAFRANHVRMKQVEVFTFHPPPIMGHTSKEGMRVCVARTWSGSTFPEAERLMFSSSPRLEVEVELTDCAYASAICAESPEGARTLAAYLIDVCHSIVAHVTLNPCVQR